MSEKGIIIVPAALVKKIDDNRGDMSQASLIEFLIDSQLKHESEEGYATKEEIQSYEQDIKKLLGSFFDFFVSYELELDKQSPQTEFEELISKLEGLGKELVLSAKYEKGGDGFRHYED